MEVTKKQQKEKETCLLYTVWKLQKFTLTLFGKNFVKATNLLKKSLNS